MLNLYNIIGTHLIFSLRQIFIKLFSVIFKHDPLMAGQVIIVVCAVQAALLFLPMFKFSYFFSSEQVSEANILH